MERRLFSPNLITTQCVSLEAQKSRTRNSLTTVHFRYLAERFGGKVTETRERIRVPPKNCMGKG
ncbi:hypothetical protein E2C01_049531 [Portunus trituberculatus]|uniref:Uncharacterized protein n=1 Tax=Portunus trituberculatus TaxID=210409 RepID=A0A5B7GDC8_PORTR|nr:hypothetical protein [Portunus trituberculatus]